MYSFDSVIRYSEIDEDATLSITSLIDYLQDCALFHSEAVGHGVIHAATPNLRWLLSAWEIQIARLPRFAEHVRTSTWATQFKGLFAHRNFTMVTDDGEELVRADSQWFMFDHATGRPVRPPADETDAYAADLAHDKPLAMPPLVRAIPVKGDGVGEPIAANPVAVTHAYIDTNHHVNNAQYVRMALIAMTEAGILSEARSSQVRRLDVQYREAAKLGDTVCPHVRLLSGEALRANLDERELASVRLGCTVSLDDERGRAYAVVRVRG